VRIIRFFRSLAFRSPTLKTLAALGLFAHATHGMAAPKAGTAPVWQENPYPSTYKPYPGEPVAIVGATVFDGTGAEIPGGVVLVREGKVVAVGDAKLAVPEGYRSIDGKGKYVTPGVIDIHSHLGVYASPGVPAHADGNEATAPTTPEVWAEHSVWPQDPGFCARSPMAGSRRCRSCQARPISSVGVRWCSECLMPAPCRA